MIGEKINSFTIKTEFTEKNRFEDVPMVLVECSCSNVKVYPLMLIINNKIKSCGDRDPRKTYVFIPRGGT